MRIAPFRTMQTFLVLAFVAVLPMPAQDAPPSESGTTVEGEATHIEILGASVSAGFVDSPATGGSKDNASLPLLVPIKKWIDGAEFQAKSRADLLMFLSPVARGAAQVERAQRQKPDLVVAVDFLFWFAYGEMADVEPPEDEQRMSRILGALEKLDQLPCPILVGDLPDMRGADRRMLRPTQIPNETALRTMNEAIAVWAKERPRVRVFPLARLVAEMKEKGVVLLLKDREVPTRPGALLQGDRLHATRLGVAYLCSVLEPEIRAALPEDARAALPKVTFEDFCAHCGAEDELAERDAQAKDVSPTRTDKPVGK